MEGGGGVKDLSNGTWTPIADGLPKAGDVIACKAPHAEGGLMYWAGTVVKVNPPFAVMETRGAFIRQFIITHDTDWIKLPTP